MIRRWVWFGIYAMLGLAMVVCGLLVPAHLRAVDAKVIEKAGKNSPTLVEEGLKLVNQRKLGAAQLLLQAAQADTLPDHEKLGEVSDAVAVRYPNLFIWGGEEPLLEKLFGTTQIRGEKSPPFTSFIIRSENRAKALEHLQESRDPFAQALTSSRSLTNTVLFSPSFSSSGQAFDAAIAICGLLGQQAKLTPSLSNEVLAATSRAGLENDSHAFEGMLMDFMSLGQRMNWGQLSAFVSRIEDGQTLAELAVFVRKDVGVPALFSAVELSEKPASVANYLMTFGDTGTRDLQLSLRGGRGGVTELLERNHQIYESSFQKKLSSLPLLKTISSVATEFSLRMGWLALMVKWFLYLAGGFMMAAAVHYAKPVPEAERPLEVRGMHLAREFLFALGFLLAVLLVSEPFLSQAMQRTEMPFRIKLPVVGSVVPEKPAVEHMTFMNPNLITLLLFFVIQGLIYTACVFKLAEIRRQNVPARVKIKLLENEDHLFDAGIYVGFVGTIVSLVLVSMGIAALGLMAAYSSTSFGIVSVSIIKIFHVRPLRRKLLLESEAMFPETAPAPTTHPLPASL
jgi:hypothetical protein